MYPEKVLKLTFKTRKDTMMRSITKLMIICLLTMIITSIPNLKVSADNNNCPGCFAWTWTCQVSGKTYIDTIACMEDYPQVDEYYFAYAIIGDSGMQWRFVLLQLGENEWCDEPCHEYQQRTELILDHGEMLWRKDFYITDGPNFLEPEVCEGASIAYEPPELY